MGALLARLRNAARHAARAARHETRVGIGDLVIDLDERPVLRSAVQVRLTPKEYDLLAVLAKSAGRVVMHRQILAAVWGPAHHDDTQYLRVFIRQLRARTEPDPNAPTLIHAEPGAGYHFTKTDV